MTVMTMGSAWAWAGGGPQIPPASDCAHCHDCNPLYESVARRVIHALQLPLIEETQEDLREDFPHLNFVNPLSRNPIRRLHAQVDRIKRISGLYAASFRWLVHIGVPIPFVGAAAHNA